MGTEFPPYTPNGNISNPQHLLLQCFCCVNSKSGSFKITKTRQKANAFLYIISRRKITKYFLPGKKVWGVFLCIKNPSYLYTVKICTKKYSEFEDLISTDRMRKYIAACGNDTRKAMKLYRLNLKI